MKRRKKNKPPDVYAGAPLSISSLEETISSFKKERTSMLKKGLGNLALLVTYEIKVIEKELEGRKISLKLHKRSKNKIVSMIEEKKSIIKSIKIYDNFFYIKQYIEETKGFIKGLIFYI